jgi:RNA polymerase-binding transcription factor DksA
MTEQEFSSGKASSSGAGEAPLDDEVVSEARALLSAVESELAAIERALSRLEEGVYGTCEVCGEAIESNRLVADPAALRCAAHEVLLSERP